jgi:hypothetical protein
MQVNIYYNGEMQKFDLEASDIRQVFSLLELQFSDNSLGNFIKQNPHYYILSNGTDSMCLESCVFGTPFDGFHTLTILPEIGGELPAAAIAAAAAYGGITLTGIALYAVTAVVNLVVMLAVNMIMSAISPTPEFNSDISSAQTKQSNLFNGAPPIREQGGVVPLVFGQPYCTGVLISSGAFSEDV